MTSRPTFTPTSGSGCWRFAADVGKVSDEQVREQGERMLKESLTQHRHELVREALGQARSNGRGVTGLRRVLRSLEMGEVQTLLMAENYTAHAVECPAAAILTRTWCAIVRCVAGARKSWKMFAKPWSRRPSVATLSWCT